MADQIWGTFHFHSTYSHDGRSTLPAIASKLQGEGLSFCVMTDHFEDFDAPKLDRYIQEIQRVTEDTGFVMIPGIEVNVSGLDTLLFPIRDFREIRALQLEGAIPTKMFKAVAHPTKYAFDRVVNHLERYRLDGIELWNQQADGAHIPPTHLFELLAKYQRRAHYHYFFGCDIHNVKFTVVNRIGVESSTAREAAAISDELMGGRFICENRPTGIAFHNGLDEVALDAWIKVTAERTFIKGKVLRGVRHTLKSCYKALSPDMQRSLNDVKNFVRSKV